MEEKSDKYYEALAEFQDMNYRMYKKACEKVLFESHYNDIKAKIESNYEGRDEFEKLFYKETKKLVKNTRNIALTGFQWLTFTVDPAKFGSSEEYLPRLKKKIAKGNSKKCVLRSIWNFELTREGVPHSHCLIELNPEEAISRDKFAKGFMNTFKDVGYVKIKSCPEEWVQDKIQYIKGIKWDEDKEEMVQADRAWRKEQGLEEFYTHGAPWPDVSS